MQRPIIYVLVSLITGILAGSYGTASVYLLSAAAILNLLLLLSALRNKWRLSGFILILFFTFLLGVFNIQKQKYFAGDCLNIINFTDQGKISAEGFIIDSPLTYADKNVLIVRCVRIVNGRSLVPVSGDVRLAIPTALNFQYGDFIRFNSTLKKIRSFRNPGNYNYERMLNLQGIYASGFINDDSGIILLRKNSLNPLRLKLELFRSRLQRIIHDHSVSPQKEIIEAMTLGNQNEIPDEIRDNFSKTGTSHILSISGLHIAMVASLSFLFFLFILKSSEYMMLRFNIIKLAASAAFLLVLSYAFISGMGVTVMRSTLMAFIFLLALLFGKQKDFYSILAVAGLAILLLTPSALFDISFQLSFMSVWAIIYIVPRFSEPPLKIPDVPSGLQGIIRYVYTSAVVCAAATAGTLPLIMFYFDRVSCVTIIANLIAVPLLGTLTLAIAMLFILFALFSTTISGWCIKLASLPAQLSIHVINTLASWPWSYFNIAKPDFIEIILFYLCLYFIIQFIDERRKKDGNDFSSLRFRAFKYLSFLSVLLIAAHLAYFTAKNYMSPEMKVTIIDVGQGNSVFVQFLGGNTMLIDGGGFPDSSFDPGKSVIAPFLYHERVNKIDTIVLSHPHPDHLLGLIYIMNNFSPREIWKSYLPVDSEIYPGWENAIRKNKIHVSVVSCESGDQIINGVRVRILWPPSNNIKDTNNIPYDEVNDTSLVLKLTLGKVGILIPGDISSDIEKRLIASGADLKSDVLIVPHHGSAYSSSPEFIKAAGCRFAVISAGKSNVFKHPHPSVIQRYKEAGVRIFRTDRDGAVTVVTDGINLRVNKFIQDE